jgi:hypothetical protein
VKKPKEIGLNKETYRWLNNQSKYKPNDDQWFKASYPIFAQGKKPISEEELFQIIAYAYSWMPTIPNVKPITNKEWLTISSLLKRIDTKSNALEQLLFILIPIINNSLVGTSKVLHFISPVRMPIIDSRVRKAWNKIFAKRKDLKLKGLLVTKGNLQSVIDSYLTYCSNISKWQEACGKGVSIRDIESLLYSQK